MLRLTHMRFTGSGQSAPSTRTGPNDNTVSDNPNFELKTADAIGLYLNPLAHPAPFCVDEKNLDTGTQPTRSDPVLPLSTLADRLECSSEMALRLVDTASCPSTLAFNIKIGEILGKTTHSIPTQKFVTFLADIRDRQP